MDKEHNKNSNVNQSKNDCKLDGCDKHNNPDCEKCFYTTRAESPEDSTWEEEAREIISKVCCDGQFVDESVDFIRKVEAQAREDMRKLIENAVSDYMGRKHEDVPRIHPIHETVILNIIKSAKYGEEGADKEIN